LAGGVATASLVTVGVLVAGGGEPRAAEPASPAQPTTTVERRDLVDRESISGTLGYADTGTLAAGVSGTLTALRDPGSVISRGHSLYDVDGKHAAFLLYGALPVWRDFTPGMTDGADVKQLERNLRAMGHDPGTVDGDWDFSTTAAVKAFQTARGLTADGSLTRGQIVFRPGPTRIGEGKASVGDQASPGRPLASISSTARRVTVDLDARRQQVARMGDKVTVELPTGRTTTGRISDVGTVAAKASRDSNATIPVTITLRSRAGGLDQAPADVGFAVARRHNVLAVPVKALLARQGGGYAVEVVGRGMVRVTPGLYADDLVEVEGDGLHAGDKVVTAL
jgi:peptidoglycan hydrolase-like protein with peptidoglycan-binding domain